MNKQKYSIKFTKNHIIENIIINSDLTKKLIGGRINDDYSNEEIIGLWQNPDYNKKYLDLYKLVNMYLLNKEFKIKQEYLDAIKVNSNEEFYDFLNYYINKLSNIIAKNISDKDIILYRGEARHEFNYGIGDVIFYPTFHSASSSISVAYKFAECWNIEIDKPCVKILYVFDLPAKSYYKKLDTLLQTYNYDHNITYLIDEKEYLIIPNSYYVIVDKQIIYNNVIVIKMKLIFQDIKKDNKDFKSYVPLKLIPTNEQLDYFTDKKLDHFKQLTENYSDMVNIILSMSEYNVSIDIYDILYLEKYSNLFNLDIKQIYKLSKDINEINIKNIAKRIRKLGIEYTNYELSNSKNYIKKIDTMYNIISYNFKIINDINLYVGFNNINRLFEEDTFIKKISKLNTNDRLIWDQILVTQLIPSKYYYNDIYNDDYPRMNIIKDNKKVLRYYSHVIEFVIDKAKICICNNHYHDFENNIIIIPKNNCILLSKEIKYNKFNLQYNYYKISLSYID